MSLYTVSTGNVAQAADLNQLINLFNGTDTATQVTVANRIRAQMTGATAASGYVGGTGTGAPASGTFSVGDFVAAQDGNIWVCTAAGTPGTWKQVGIQIDTTATDIQALGAQAAGSIGKAADAGHVHPTTGLAVLSAANTFTGTSTTIQNTLNAYTVNINTSLNLAANSANTVPTLPSANGARIFIQSAQPTGNDGDVWIAG